MARARRHRSENGAEDGGGLVGLSRRRLTALKAANDNRLGLRSWLERVVALAALIGLVALVLWKSLG